MKSARQLLASCGVMLVFGLSTAAAAEGWLTDFEKAKAEAKAQGKDLLMEFTGSDWCPPCKALQAKVLDTEVFKSKTPEKYVLLKLDNPRDKSKQTPEEIEQYKVLSKAYKVRGVPTIVLADPQGRPFAQMVGYGGTAAEAYVDDLLDKTELREKRDELLAKAAEAEGVEKAKLLNEALQDIDSKLVISQYQPIVEEIVTLDSDNSAGLKDKYAGLLKQEAVREKLDEIQNTAGTSSPEEIVAKIDDLIHQLQPEGEALQVALFQKAGLVFGKDKTKSKEILEAAVKVAPDSDLSRQITFILQSQFKEEPAAEDEPEGDAKKSGEKSKPGKK